MKWWSIGIVCVVFGIVYLVYEQSNQPINMEVSGDVVLANNLSEMSKKAPIIVEGSFVKLDSSENGARNPKNPSKPASDIYNEVKIYQFQVDDELKGDVAKEAIEVGYEYSMELEHLTSAKKVRIQDPLWVKPKMGKNYILFLNPPDQYTHYYTSAFTPSRIEVNSDSRVKLILPKRGIQKHQFERDGKRFNVSMEGFPTDYTNTISGKDVGEIEKIIKQEITK
ncbi:hypothetical protein [Marininema halotolerans]|uniref:Uncharacterized protein n=1 Tax=Marininema halotolerans TaxID=1155944 RepID=A0A1I6QNU2_9BACL|nr:hypothetical protein [Marininema halotolerans]SFS54141.1 hypothetical protein SAMN05444972_103278 [Marininema halotolerans]